jgi:fatty acid desaturase
MKTGFDYEFDPNQKIASKIYLFISIFIDIKLMVRAFVYTFQNSFSIVKGPLGQEEFGRGTINSEKLKNAARIILISNILIFLFFATCGNAVYATMYLISPFVFTSVAKILALSQHYGMDIDIKDIDKTTRSISLPRWLEFLYANMNYHIEHHVYPSVPYYNLSKVSAIINKNSDYIGFYGVLKLIYGRN